MNQERITRLRETILNDLSISYEAVEYIARNPERSRRVERAWQVEDLRFGMGMSATHIRDCGRRDRLFEATWTDRDLTASAQRGAKDEPRLR